MVNDLTMAKVAGWVKRHVWLRESYQRDSRGIHSANMPILLDDDGKIDSTMLDSADIGAMLTAATAKTTPVDADTMPLNDSAASNVLKKVTWANIKATLLTYFTTLFPLLAGKASGQTINGGTAANEDLTLSGTAHATKTSSYVLLQPSGGNVGIGTAAPATSLHIHTATGSNPSLRVTDADVDHGITLFAITADTLLQISPPSSTNGGALLWGLSDSAATEGFAFWGVVGDVVPTVAPVMYSAGKKNGTTVQALAAAEEAFAWYNSGAGALKGAKLAAIFGDGRMQVGPTAARGKLDVDQESTTAAIPVLVLDQADVSEEMIEFVTTIGTGNAIEAVGAKTLTTTHFIKVTIPGGLTRYIPVGTIA